MIALIPLDDRPCNTRFVQQIAALGADEISLAPRELLGRFNTAGSPELLARWLEDSPPVSALIVSVDMLAYGGLVASRRPTVAVDSALENLRVLAGFRAKNPDVKIYAFNVLMRLAVTMDGDDAVANYYNIMRYARLCDEAERFDSAHLRAELEKVHAEIEPRVLAQYLAARARNHAVNMQMLDWLHGGTFDFLLITQEDATEFGLHRREQDALLARAEELGVVEKMSLHPGADEAALTLLARHWNSGARFRVHWSNKEDAHRIAPFEDRPYDVALAQHVAAMRGELVDEGAGDFELFVNAPVGGSQKDESDESKKARATQLLSFSRTLEEHAKSASPSAQLPASTRAADFETSPLGVALCDVAFPNGADNLLMTELEKRGTLGYLAAYGGWNTAGNTTGTVLAQCAAIKRATSLHGDYDRALNRQFLFERIVDDWFYQAQVRARIEKSAREQGVSPLNMGDAGEAVEAQARRELRGFAQLLARRHFRTDLAKTEISLPWQRSFEADVHMELV